MRHRNMALLSAVLTCVTSASFAEADQTELTEGDRYAELSLRELLDIPVTAVSKVEEPLEEAPMAVYVIEKEEFDRWGIKQLYEVFQRIPGYSFYNTDYYGQYGAIGRGMQSIWRFGFSFDLMPIPDFGHLVFAPHLFKRMEVARGPAGLMWGSSASAGLVNMEIRNDLKGAEVYLEGGTFNRRSIEILYGGQLGNGDYYTLGWNWQAHDHELERNAFEGTLAYPRRLKKNGLKPSRFFMGALKYKNLKLVILRDHAQHVIPMLWFGGDRRAELDAALTAESGDDFGDQLEMDGYRVEYHLPIPGRNFETYFYYNWFKRLWQTESVAMGQHRKQAAGFATQLKLLDQRLHLNIGGDLWAHEELHSPNITTPWAAQFGINWWDDIIHPVGWNSSGLYAQAKYTIIEGLKAVVGGRADYQHYGNDRDILFSGPRLGVLYRLDEHWNFKLLHNDTIRRPASNEINNGEFPDPERQRADEFITTLRTSRLTADLTLFRQRLSDQITRVETADLNEFRNISGQTTYGVEWSLRARPFRQALVYWNGSYNHARVDKGAIGGEVIAGPHDDRDRPLFAPLFTSFIGAEVPVTRYARFNAALRTIYDIPYERLGGGYGLASANFVDATIRSSRFWKGRLQASATVLNLLDNIKGLPAYGEHLTNQPGLVEPEGRKIMVRLNMTLQGI